jgi:hypothetical protein
MTRTVPQAAAGTELEKEKIRRAIEARQLVGAANDTKWGELLDAIRRRQGWRPSYRFKCVAGPISRWDVDGGTTCRYR